MFRILVADDYPVVRTGLKGIIGQQNWTVCAEAADGIEAVSKTLEQRPDLVILDISMPLLSGIGAASKIKQAMPRTKILILSMHDTSTMSNVLLSAGVDAWLSKATSNEELVQTVAKLLKDREGKAGKDACGPVSTPL